MAQSKSGRFAALWLLPIILSAAAWTPIGTQAAKGGASAGAAAAPSGCGSGGSWAVKIGTDSQAGQVDQTSPPTPTTVAQMTSLPLPNPINHRVQPTETTVYVLTATVTRVYQEHDMDLHMAINDGAGHFMIAELPDTACVPTSSVFYSGISRARSQYMAWAGSPPATVQITGVGFFDGFTGQSGQAPNQIELHPILNLNFNPAASTGSVTGQLTSSSGGAIAGGVVSDSGGASATTNSTGTYTLSGLPPGSHTLTASASGFSSATQTATVTAGTTTSGVNFILTPSTGAVAGTVNSASGGAAISGATVSDSGGASTITDSRGAYTLSGLSPGNHTLTASLPTFASADRTTWVTSGQTTTGVNFGLTPLAISGAVSGSVTSTSGTAIVSALVRDIGGDATTNSAGAYTLNGLAPGSHTLTASAPGFTSVTQTVSVTSGTTTPNVNFSLPPSPSPTPLLVQSSGATESSPSTSLTDTLSTSTFAGHLLVLSASVYTGSTNQIKLVSDSAGNTWTRIGSYAVAGHNSDGEMWYAANAAAVTSVTVQTSNPALVALQVQEFSGVATASPLDVSAGTANTSTSPASGSVTPTAATDLAVGFIAGHASAEQISVTAAGYSAQGQQTSNGGGSAIATIVSGYQVLTSSGGQNFSGSFTSPMYWAAGIVCFKAAA